MKPFKTTDFFATHAVFRTDEFLAGYCAEGHSAATGQVLLNYHLKAGAIHRVRQGLYATTPDFVDPWLVGSRLVPGGVLAYEGALSFHGLTGLYFSIPVVSEARFTRLSFQDVIYVRVQPTELKDRGVIKAERLGLPLRVTSVSRTLVDVLDRPDFSPQPDDVWNAFMQAHRALDFEEMTNFALKLGRAATCARLGFFLEALKAPQSLLRQLEAASPPGSTYLQRNLTMPGTLGYARRWKLIAPRHITNLGWEVSR